MTIRIPVQRPGIPSVDPNLPDTLQGLLQPIKENIEIANGTIGGWSRRSVTLGMLVQLGIISESEAISVSRSP